MSYRSVVAELESLESRRLLSAAYPTADEQYLVQLVNLARANPSAEAARDGIDLNEGLSAGTISTAAKQPLAINPYLTDSARKHSQWMIDNNTFSHYEGSSDPGDRMTAAGYAFTGSWTWGENIGWNGSTGTINPDTTTAQIEQSLFVDSGVDGRGHRVNLMNDSFREIGGGVVTGQFTSGTTYNAVMATQDFAASGSSVFLTGAAYSDAIIKDNFYTPGEGLGGVTVTAVRASDQSVFSMQTWSSGGYSLALPAGTYTVTASGGGLGGTVTDTNVVIGSENVEADFTPAQATNSSFASLVNGTLTINGTSGVDLITLDASGGNYIATLNKASQTFAALSVSNVEIFAGDGDDAIFIGTGVMGVYVDAGAGNDYIQGGDGPDTLTGGANKDRIYGGAGDDRLNGNGGHDQLFGEAGKDRLYGGDGNDTLDGGAGVDRLWGQAGNNVYYGQGGNDYMYAQSNSADTLFGGSGTDHAQIDNIDTIFSVEEVLP